MSTNNYIHDIFYAAMQEKDKACERFPQPNYVVLKIAEEADEVVKAAIHYSEGRETWANVEKEAIQVIAMVLRLLDEGDHILGAVPPTDKDDGA